MAQYVFRPNDAFSFRERQIVMAKPVANDAISRKVFKPDELVWIDGWIADVMGRPDQWIPTWMAFLGLRTRGLQARFTSRGGRRGFQYSSKFLALFSVHHTVVFRCIQESNRPALAAELRKHPYEAELLKGDRFTGSVINGVLAESAGPPTAPVSPAEPLTRCAYCGMSYKLSEPRCSHCGANQ